MLSVGYLNSCNSKQLTERKISTVLMTGVTYFDLFQKYACLEGARACRV